MTSRQAKQTGENAKKQKRKSSKPHRSSKEPEQTPSRPITHQDQPTTSPQFHPEEHSQTSQYQDTSSTDLPLATTWPNGTTIPNQTDMNYSLLGLTLNPPATQHASNPYDQMTHQYQLQRHIDVYPRAGAGVAPAAAEFHIPAMPSPGYGMTVMGRWISERPSQQGALLAWD
ncbi:hypothetical protein BKA61DRAFT_737854 [Leptodontidium sp. MPI-SDFR-AT-0119]|nr:hypothetical protein BKA61DRAFT_737854 [Leptodontidium sp. MPI-SDFR-AT-0119]